MTHSRSELEAIHAAVEDMLEPEPELCRICSKPRAAHRELDIIHEFMPQNAQASLVARSQQSRDAHEGNRQGAQGAPAQRSSDAILRMVLLRKGLIAVEDIDAVEQELKASGAAYFPQGDENASRVGDA